MRKKQSSWVFCDFITEKMLCSGYTVNKNDRLVDFRKAAGNAAAAKCDLIPRKNPDSSAGHWGK